MRDPRVEPLHPRQRTRALRIPITVLGAVTILGALVMNGAGAAGCNQQPKDATDEHWTGAKKSAGSPAARGSDGEKEKEKASADAPSRRRGAPAARRPSAATGKRPRVAVRTSMGDFMLELYADKAPITVKNFLRYVDEKFYDGTIFHRVMSSFMIQGGGFTPDLRKKETHDPIENEANNGLSNQRGTVAMARTRAKDSATAQFFVNVVDNAKLDHRGPGPRFGYTVFGKVVEGMNVVDKIRRTPVERKSRRFTHLPKETVVIKSIRPVK